MKGGFYTKAALKACEERVIYAILKPSDQGNCLSLRHKEEWLLSLWISLLFKQKALLYSIDLLIGLKTVCHHQNRIEYLQLFVCKLWFIYAVILIFVIWAICLLCAFFVHNASNSCTFSSDCVLFHLFVCFHSIIRSRFIHIISCLFTILTFV